MLVRPDKHLFILGRSAIRFLSSARPVVVDRLKGEHEGNVFIKEFSRSRHFCRYRRSAAKQTGDKECHQSTDAFSGIIALYIIPMSMFKHIFSCGNRLVS